MGTETHYEAVIEHPELGILTWGLWEYPEGIENHQSTDAGKHEVINDFHYGLEHDVPEPDDWVNYEVPDNPYTIFQISHRDAANLLLDHEETHRSSLLNRMVFSHQITALEAYLADTLINEVMGDVGALQRLIGKATELMDKKFTLIEVAESPNLVQTTVRTYLRTILYHNLKKVDVLYDIALGVRVLNLVKDKSTLFKAVSLRHDCVHRNGFDNEGKELTVFTKEFVQATAVLILDLVNSIEMAVNNRQGDTF